MEPSLSPGGTATRAMRSRSKPTYKESFARFVFAQIRKRENILEHQVEVSLPQIEVIRARSEEARLGWRIRQCCAVTYHVDTLGTVNKESLQDRVANGTDGEIGTSTIAPEIC